MRSTFFFHPATRKGDVINVLLASSLTKRPCTSLFVPGGLSFGVVSSRLKPWFVVVFVVHCPGIPGAAVACFSGGVVVVVAVVVVVVGEISGYSSRRVISCFVRGIVLRATAPVVVLDATQTDDFRG